MYCAGLLVSRFDNLFSLSSQKDVHIAFGRGMHARSKLANHLLLQQASASHRIVKNRGQSLEMTCGSHAGECRSWLTARRLQPAAAHVRHRANQTHLKLPARMHGARGCYERNVPPTINCAFVHLIARFVSLQMPFLFILLLCTDMQINQADSYANSRINLQTLLRLHATNDGCMNAGNIRTYR